MKKLYLRGAFTLVEIIIGILIVSMVVIAGFQALSSVSF
jgi:prepilin-type N-terminal cleavage/methylation domain-containing protein